LRGALQLFAIFQHHLDEIFGVPEGLKDRARAFKPALIHRLIEAALRALPGRSSSPGLHFQSSTFGAWVSVNGGWPDGQAIADGLANIAINAIPKVQAEITSALAPFAAAQFSSLYLLPGNGTKSLQAAPLENATADTALAVVSVVYGRIRDMNTTIFETIQQSLKQHGFVVEAEPARTYQCLSFWAL